MSKDQKTNTTTTVPNNDPDSSLQSLTSSQIITDNESNINVGLSSPYTPEMEQEAKTALNLVLYQHMEQTEETKETTTTDILIDICGIPYHGLCTFMQGTIPTMLIYDYATHQILRYAILGGLAGSSSGSAIMVVEALKKISPLIINYPQEAFLTVLFANFFVYPKHLVGLFKSSANTIGHLYDGIMAIGEHEKKVTYEIFYTRLTDLSEASGEEKEVKEDEVVYKSYAINSGEQELVGVYNTVSLVGDDNTGEDFVVLNNHTNDVHSSSFCLIS